MSLRCHDTCRDTCRDNTRRGINHPSIVHQKRVHHTSQRVCLPSSSHPQVEAIVFALVRHAPHASGDAVAKLARGVAVQAIEAGLIEASATLQYVTSRNRTEQNRTVQNTKSHHITSHHITGRAHRSKCCGAFCVDSVRLSSSNVNVTASGGTDDDCGSVPSARRLPSLLKR